MILSTTSTIASKKIVQYQGLVTGSFVADLKERNSAEDEAIKRITDQAKKNGANAIVGISFCNSHSADSNAQFTKKDYTVLIYISGTAVTVE